MQQQHMSTTSCEGRTDPSLSRARSPAPCTALAYLRDGLAHGDEVVQVAVRAHGGLLERNLPDDLSQQPARQPAPHVSRRHGPACGDLREGLRHAGCGDGHRVSPHGEEGGCAAGVSGRGPAARAGPSCCLLSVSIACAAPGCDTRRHVPLRRIAVSRLSSVLHHTHTPTNCAECAKITSTVHIKLSGVLLRGRRIFLLRRLRCGRWRRLGDALTGRGAA
jgi:hypothetical protein